MAQDGSANIAEAGDDVDHTWREASLLYQSSDFCGLLSSVYCRSVEGMTYSQWSLFRTLQDHSIPNNESRCQLVGQKQQWNVPGNNASYNTVRLTQRHVDISRSLDARGTWSMLVACCKPHTQPSYPAHCIQLLHNDPTSPQKHRHRRTRLLDDP